MNAQLSANFITMQNIINCYIRETGKGVWQSISEMKSEETLVLRLEKQPVTLYFPVKYRSATGRHLFFPIFYYRIQKRGAQGVRCRHSFSLSFKRSNRSFTTGE